MDAKLQARIEKAKTVVTAKKAVKFFGGELCGQVRNALSLSPLDKTAGKNLAASIESLAKIAEKVNPVDDGLNYGQTVFFDKSFWNNTTLSKKIGIGGQAIMPAEKATLSDVLGFLQTCYQMRASYFSALADLTGIEESSEPTAIVTDLDGLWGEDEDE